MLVSCVTMAMPAFSASRGALKRIASPDSVSVPASGRMWPQTMRASVDLPAPLEPNSAWTSPAASSKSACVKALAPPKDLATALAERSEVIRAAPPFGSGRARSKPPPGPPWTPARPLPDGGPPGK